jgi:hypothetical protein
MSTASKRHRRPVHAATTHDGRRRRGGTPRTEPLFGARGAAASPAKGAAREGSVPARAGERRRLEEVVLTTWAALAAGHPVECPVCGGPLTAADGCSSCGSRLT